VKGSDLDLLDSLDYTSRVHKNSDTFHAISCIRMSNTGFTVQLSHRPWSQPLLIEKMFVEKRKANRKSPNARCISITRSRNALRMRFHFFVDRINFTQRELTLCLTAFRPVRLISCRSSHVYN